MSNPFAQIPVIGGLFDDTDEQAMDQLRQASGLYQGLQTPDYQKYQPEMYKYLGGFTPQDAQYQTVSEDPMTRSAQLAALNKMQSLASTGLSDVDAQGFDQARRAGAQQAQQGVASALNDAQARHVGGSGMEFAMREMANQNGADRAQQAALAQAGDSARMRAAYQQAYGGQLEGMRNQDYRAQAGNADIINRFNQQNTQNHNQANQYNVQMQQATQNANVDARNNAQNVNNQLQQQHYKDQLAKAQGQASGYQGMAQGYAAQNAANQNARNQNTQMGMNALMFAGL